MDEQDWLRRIDEHLEVSKGYMREGHEIMARNERAFLDLQSYLHEATTALGLMNAELRQGRREQNAQWRQWRKEWNEWRAEWKVDREEWKVDREEWNRRSEESNRRSEKREAERRAESRAFLDALFAILDRLNNQPPPSAA